MGTKPQVINWGNPLSQPSGKMTTCYVVKEATSSSEKMMSSVGGQETAIFMSSHNNFTV